MLDKLQKQVCRDICMYLCMCMSEIGPGKFSVHTKIDILRLTEKYSTKHDFHSLFIFVALASSALP